MRLVKLLFQSLVLRVEQELIIFRYILFCSASRKTRAIFLLRNLCLLILLTSFAYIYFILYQLGFSVVIASLFILNSVLFFRFIARFGYSREHILVFSKLVVFSVLTLSLIQLDYYYSVSAQSMKYSGFLPIKTLNTGMAYAQTLPFSVPPVNDFVYSKEIVFNPQEKARVQEIFSFLDLVDDSLVSENVVEAAVSGEPLFYPNPFRISEGGVLGYRLSIPMDIEIRMYDMQMNEVFRNAYPAGLNGGRGGSEYNRITFDETSFNGFSVSSGVYFFVLIYEGRVLEKGKVVIVP